MQGRHFKFAKNSLVIGIIATTTVLGTRIVKPLANRTGVPDWSALPVFTPLRRFDAGAKSAHGAGKSLRTSHGWAASSEGTSQGGTMLSTRQIKALEMNFGRHSLLKHSRTGLLAPQGDPDLPARVVQLKDIFGAEYIGAIGVGTARGPKGEMTSESQLRVIYDTGSADLWVTSDLCKYPPCTNSGHLRYNHSRSETFQSPASLMQIETVYGSGELEGQLGFDTVQVGPFEIRNQGFGLIQKEKGSAFEILPLDGICGLAFPSLASVEKVPPVMDSLMLQHSLPMNLFAFYFHEYSEDGGLVLWGGIDSRLYEGPLVWFPVVEQEYWTLDMLSLRVGDKAIHFESPANDSLSFSSSGGGRNRGRGQLRKSSGQERTASSGPPKLIVDSGTTVFALPKDLLYKLVWRKIPRSTTCSEINKLPQVVFTVRNSTGGPHDLVVPPEVYMAHDGRFPNNCVPGFMPLDIDNEDARPLIIIGEVFMRHYFTVFSRGFEGPPGSDSPPPYPAIGMAPARRGGDADIFLSQVTAPAEMTIG